MKKTVFLFLLISAGIFSFTGCSSKADKKEGIKTEKIVLTGSSTLAPLAEEIGKRYEKLHPAVRVDVQTGGSSRGIRDIHSGASDIGMSSRSLHPEELKGVQADAVAYDGVAFVINASNPVERLTKEQLRNIYTGKIRNWKEAGGDDAPVVVSNRAEGRSELELVSKYLSLELKDIQADVIDGETQQSLKTVTNNKNAITYVSLGAAEYAKAHQSPLKLLPLEGVEATTAHVQDGTFPLARPLLMLRRKDEKREVVNDFLNFALSGAVDDLTGKLGYVPPGR